jgi:uncharacterized membrane protein SpoIIM required for sporulation
VSAAPAPVRPGEAEPALKSARFRKAREADWLKLERLLDTLQSKPLSRLSDEDLLAIPVLYRSTLSALSVARETSLDSGLLEYLEGLAARAYFVVYGARPSLRARLARFFREDWPAAARALWRESLLSAALLVAGAVAAAVLIGVEPDWYDAFIPGALAGGRGMDSSTEHLRAILYSTEGRNMLEVFAAFLFTHNAQIALMAFALGFAFGVPTALLVFSNGCALGALMTLYARHGLLVPLTGWLMIHGVTELLATVLAGAAGFHIGWTLAFPGARTRMQAMSAAGRRAATLMAGVVVMLMVAGLLEGIGRQLITSDIARYAIALASAVFWGAYLYAPRRGRSTGR